jgi:hypothetical protein
MTYLFPLLQNVFNFNKLHGKNKSNLKSMHNPYMGGRIANSIIGSSSGSTNQHLNFVANFKHQN